MSVSVFIIGQLWVDWYYLRDQTVNADVNAVGPIL